MARSVPGNLPQLMLVVFDEFNNTSHSPELRILMKVFLEVAPPQVLIMLASRPGKDSVLIVPSGVETAAAVCEQLPYALFLK